MFLALGIGAWSAAIFHFMIHAFFKALLFLAAGSVILLLHEEHDMFRMGGLRKKLPTVFITFLIGGASLSALPLITAGFYSKDQILWFSWSSETGQQMAVACRYHRCFHNLIVHLPDDLPYFLWRNQNRTKAYTGQAYVRSAHYTCLFICCRRIY